MRRNWTRRGILAAAAMLPAARAGAEEALRGTEALVPDTAPVPPFRFTDAAGAERTLADWPGRPVLLNFWATWCAPCVAEMPALDRLAAALPTLAILPLSSDRLGAPAVQRFFAANAITHLPVLLDPKGDAARAAGSEGIPTTLLLNRSGATVARVNGSLGWDTPSVLQWLRTNLPTG